MNSVVDLQHGCKALFKVHNDIVFIFTLQGDQVFGLGFEEWEQCLNKLVSVIDAAFRFLG